MPFSSSGCTPAGAGAAGAVAVTAGVCVAAAEVVGVLVTWPAASVAATLGDVGEGCEVMTLTIGVGVAAVRPGANTVQDSMARHNIRMGNSGRFFIFPHVF